MHKNKLKRRHTALTEALEPRRLLAAQIVYDLNTQPTNNTGLYGLVSTGPVAYVAGNDGTAGLELWQTDGTSAGTGFVKDILPGPAGSTPVGFARAGGFTYFTATTDAAGWELWKTDGTAAGTSLVKDINPGSASSNPAGITAAGSLVYFFADDGVHGTELWRSDGTDAGTFLVKDIRPGTTSATRSTPLIVGRSDGLAFFYAYDGTAAGNGLWESDGTEGNASVVYAASSNAGIYNLMYSGGRAYFTDILGYLYASDGTTANTKLVDSTNSSVNQMIDVGGTLYYTRSSGAVRGIGPTGSTYFTVSAALSYSPNTKSLTNVNGNLYFAATTSSPSSEILSVTGGSSSASVVNAWTSNPLPTLGNLTAVGNALFFTAVDATNGTVLWKTTGTAATTTFLKTLYTGSTSSSYAPNSFVAVGNQLVFINGDSSNTGPALWVSDGTTAGTALLRDLYAGTESSGAYPLGSVNNVILLRADTMGSLGEVWATDGTPGHMWLLADIYPGPGGSNPSTAFTWNGLAFFTADDGTNGRELWVTDGTTAGTTLLKDIYPGNGDSSAGYFTPFNGRLYFTANDGTHGTELWVTDGTSAGTALVSDLNDGSASGITSGPVVFNGALYFIGNNGTTGPELWTSDGTSGGTSLVKDIYPGPSTSFAPNYLTVSNGLLYFRANDNTHGAETWVSDGTSSGTVLVKDIYSGTSSSSPLNFTTFGNLTYFTAIDAAHGAELWVTDGTPGGTALVADLNSGTGGSSPRQLAVANGRLVFLATATDGKDYLYSIAAPGQNPTTLTPGGLAYSSTLTFNNRYYFSFDDGVHGAEAWVSDGTSGGTYLLQDLRPGWIGDTYGPFYAFRGTVYFQGDDGISFWELYRLIPPTAVTSATTYSIVPGGSIQLSAVGSSDADNLPLTYAWDLDGDGIFGETGAAATNGDETGANPTFSAAGLAANSIVTVRLRVTNPTNLSAETFATIDIGGTAPSATFSAAGTVSEGLTGFVSFANPVGTGPFTYSYDFDNDGIFEVTNSSNFTAVVPANYIPDGPAAYTIRGRITDADGLVTDLTTTLTVTNAAPSAASLSIAPTTAAAGTTVTVTLAGGTDPSTYDAASLRYSFDFTDDGIWDVINSPLPYATTSYPGGQSFPIRVRVTDKDGAYTDYTTSVTISTSTSASFAGVVFTDVNSNGTYNAGTDQPIASAKVYLDMNLNGVRDASEPYVTSDGTGAYLFYLIPGTYPIRVDLPAGYTQTLPAGNAPLLVTTYAGFPITNMNFAAAAPGLARFVVFDDANADGVRNGGESYLTGRPVYVDSNNNGSLDSGEPTALTDGTGSAVFTLAPGTYVVRQVVPITYAQTTPAVGAAWNITVTSGGNPAAKAFGIYGGSVAYAGGPYTVNEGSQITLTGTAIVPEGITLSAYEWDLNYDGVNFDVDATGSAPTFSAALLDGPTTRVVALRLRETSGIVSPVSTATVSVLNVAPTAAFPASFSIFAGDVIFWNFPNTTDPSPADVAAGFKYSIDTNGDGIYDFVDFTTPNQYATGFNNPGTYTIHARIKDKDGASTVYTSTVTVTSAYNITGHVFQDANADGIDNDGLLPLGGASVYADLNNDGIWQITEPITSTDLSGNYSLKVAPGTYILRGNFANDGFLPTVAGPRTVTVTNANVATAAFGAADKATVYFDAFNDSDGNGLRSGGESYLSGQFIYADLNNNGVFDVGEPSGSTYTNGGMITSASIRVFPGTIAFREQLAAGWEQTTPTNNQPITLTVQGGKSVSGPNFGTRPLPRVAAPVPATVAELASVPLTAIATPVSGRSIVAYEWDFNYDGATLDVDATGATASFSAAGIDGPATRTVAVRVRDSGGAVSPISTTTITITNAAPTATFGDSASPNFTGSIAAPTQISFTNPSDSPGDLAAGLRYSFDLDDDGIFEIVDSASSSASQLFSTPGTYTVRARVADKDGAYRDYTASVLITVPTYTISGASFHDANANGIFDGGEAGFTALQVYADLNNNGVKDAGEPSATPAASGAYSLALTPGTYTIRANVDTASYLPTYPAAGSYNVTVTDQGLSGYDFGAARKGTASFSLFRDDNGDGVLSTGEAGISGRTIYADTNNNGIFDSGEPSVLTNSSGNGTISLFPGAYIFRQVLPTNWAQTLPTGVQPISLTLTGGVTSPATFGARALPTISITTSPLTVAEGLSIPIASSGTPVSGRSIVAYEWDLNYNGSTFDVDASTSTATFSAAAIDGPATRNIAVRVRDSVGAVSTLVTATVTITNRAPTASFGNSGPVDEGAAGATVTFYNPSDVAVDASAGFTYSYDFDNDGTFEITDSTSLSASVPASYLADGPFVRTVRARVSDKDGGYSDFYTAITVYNIAPTLSVTPVANNTTYSLSLAASDPGQDTISSWTVDWGDGTKLAYTGATPNPSHTYYSTGTRTILVTATDEDGTFGAMAAPFAIDPSYSGDGKDSAFTTTETFADLTLIAYPHFITAGADGLNGTVATRRFDGMADNSLDGGAGFGFRAGIQTAFTNVVTNPRGGFLILGRTIDSFGNADAVVMRYTASESRDSTFGPISNNEVFVSFGSNADRVSALAVASDGSIFIGGAAGAAGTSPKFAVAKLTPAGILDTSFGNGGIALYTLPGSTSACVNALAVLPDGHILASLTGPASASLAVARLNPDGFLDTSFTGGTSSTLGIAQYTLASGAAAAGATRLAMLPDGRFLIASYGGSAVAVARFQSNGVLDPTFGSTTPGSVTLGASATVSGVSLAVGAEGRISVVFNDGSLTRVTNLTEDGATDLVLGSTTYSLTGGSDRPAVVAALPDGRLVLAVNPATTGVSAVVAMLAAGVTPVSNSVSVSPSASFANTGPVNEGAAPTASVIFSSPIGTGPFTYSFDFDNNGTFEISNSSNPIATVPSSYLKDGPTVRIVHGQIKDASGLTSDFTTTITVNNLSPTASIASTSVPFASPTPTLTFANATDPSAADVAAGFRYSFDFDNDGTFDVIDSVSPTATYTFAGSGLYTVRARIADKDSGYTDYFPTVRVLPAFPAATLSIPDTIEGSSSAIATLSSIVAAAPYTIAFDLNNDGVFEITNSASTATLPASLLLDGPASKTVRARIIDSFGQTSIFTTTFNVTSRPPSATLSAPTTANEGIPITVSLSSPIDVAADVSAGFKYSFDLDNDGTFEIAASSSPTITATFPDNGSYTIRARITDKDGDSTVYTAQIVVANQSPTATLSATPVVEGGSSTVSLTHPTDVNADLVAGLLYSFDLDSDGTFEIVDSTSSSASVTYADNGIHTVRARVADKDGGNTIYTLDINVTDVAPTATLSGSTVSENTPGLVTFTSPADVPADVEAGFTYSYDFDNNGTFEITNSISPMATVPASYLPDGPASHTVRARISDKDGGFTDYTTIVSIINTAPSASFVSPAPVPEGSSGSVTLVPTDSSPTDKAAGFRYSFDFNNDGTYEIVNTANPTATIPASYFPDGPATLTVRGRVTDKDGAVSADTTATITVTNVAPELITTAGSNLHVPVGSTYLLSLAADDPGLDTVSTWFVRWGDGETSTSHSASVLLPHQYAAAGLYTVTATATDDDGSYDLVQALTVSDSPPGATLNSSTLASDHSALQVVVTYVGDLLIDTTTIGDDDLIVTGANGTSRAVRLISAIPSSDGHTVVATYDAAAPYYEGPWDWQDNGDYTISIRESAVADTNQNTVPSWTIGKATIQLSAPDAPDLTASFLTAPRKALTNNAVNKLVAKVADVSNRPLNSTNVTTRVYLSTDPFVDSTDKVLATSTRKLALKTNAFQRVPLSFRTPVVTDTGTYYILVRTDATGVVAERNERNNTASASTKITSSSPDLAVSFGKHLKSAYLAGTTLPISLKLANVGSTTYTGNVAVSILFSADLIADESDTTLLTTTLNANLKSKGTKNFNLSAKIPDGLASHNGHLLIVTTPTATDHNLSNNTISTQLNIT